jgi:hypothetical protein
MLECCDDCYVWFCVSEDSSSCLSISLIFTFILESNQLLNPIDFVVIQITWVPAFLVFDFGYVKLSLHFFIRQAKDFKLYLLFLSYDKSIALFWLFRDQKLL